MLRQTVSNMLRNLPAQEHAVGSVRALLSQSERAWQMHCFTTSSSTTEEAEGRLKDQRLTRNVAGEGDQARASSTGHGAGIGVATGAVAGGVAAGPVGAAVGAAIGGIAGGVISPELMHASDPDREEAKGKDDGNTYAGQGIKPPGVPAGGTTGDKIRSSNK